jgi:5'-3' exonuclease
VKYLLVDANHLASRCRFAASGRQLATPDGRKSGVVFGVLRGLSFAKHQLRTDFGKVICFWDHGRSQKRMELYPQYKSGRQPVDPTPEEIEDKKQYYLQIEALLQVLPLLGIRQVRVPGCEADDLISIIARSLSETAEVVVYSGDKDLHQIVNSNIKIMNSEKVLGEQDVLSEWGLSATHLIPIAKALSGDSSDAIDGVPGIGGKRAAMLAPVVSHILGNDPKPEHFDKKLWNLVEKARPYKEVVLRNYQLVRLPMSWSESFYTSEQATDCVKQTFTPVNRSTKQFVDFCMDWHLNSILETIHQF